MLRVPRLLQARRYHACQEARTQSLMSLAKFTSTFPNSLNHLAWMDPHRYSKTSEKLFAFLWRRRFALLGITPMIESKRGIIFGSRNFDVQKGTSIFSLEKWVQRL